MIKYFLLSIIFLTGIFWGFGQGFRKKVCPICLATVLTWVFGLILMFLGRLSNLENMFVLLLMAVSLGAATERFGARFGIFWKTAMVIAGVPILYFLYINAFGKALLLGIVLGATTLIMHALKSEPAIKGTDEFKNCC